MPGGLWWVPAESGGKCGEILRSGEIFAALWWPLAETEAQERPPSGDLGSWAQAYQWSGQVILEWLYLKGHS